MSTTNMIIPTLLALYRGRKGQDTTKGTSPYTSLAARSRKHVGTPLVIMGRRRLVQTGTLRGILLICGFLRHGRLLAFCTATPEYLLSEIVVRMERTVRGTKRKLVEQRIGLPDP